jgi:hypothetical protein
MMELKNNIIFHIYFLICFCGGFGRVGCVQFDGFWGPWWKIDGWLAQEFTRKISGVEWLGIGLNLCRIVAILP